MPIALGFGDATLSTPRPRESCLGLGGLIARLLPVHCPEVPRSKRMQNREPGTGTGRGALHRLLLVCLSRKDPRRFQCSVPHWQSPGQIVFVSQEPTFTTPKSLEQRGRGGGRGARGASILPTGRPLCTISRKRADQWRAPTNGLVLKTKRPHNPETEKKNHWNMLFKVSPSPRRRNTAGQPNISHCSIIFNGVAPGLTSPPSTNVCDAAAVQNRPTTPPTPEKRRGTKRRFTTAQMQHVTRSHEWMKSGTKVRRKEGANLCAFALQGGGYERWFSPFFYFPFPSIAKTPESVGNPRAPRTQIGPPHISWNNIEAFACIILDTLHLVPGSCATPETNTRTGQSHQTEPQQSF